MPDAPFVLVVEDHHKIRMNTLMQLREDHFAAHAVRDAAEAEAFLREHEPPDVLLIDVRLGTESGIDYVRRLTEERRCPPTIAMSGEASITETVEALRLGVYDFIEKPFTRERLVQSVRNCIAHASLQRKVNALQSRVEDRYAIAGDSPQIEQIRSRAAKVAPTEARVLIRGESGTGKELVAANIHYQSVRREGPYVKINCAAIPAHLIEDELFGHARGAFTDARMAKPGLFEQAHRGTLFLDEIGDMDLGLQSRLLRVLEDGRMRRIGETTEREVDVRIIAATNRDLEQMAQQATFRDDLYFRLAAVVIDVPPLRERTGDAVLLFKRFLQHFCLANERPPLSVEPDVFTAVDRYRWPGNVRELRNVCEQLAIFGADPVTIGQLPSSMMRDNSGPPAGGSGIIRLTSATSFLSLRTFREQCEKEYVENVLRRTNWNFTAAARVLEIRRTYLHHKIHALKIERPQ